MLLDQLADIRAALFDFVVPDELAQMFLHDRLFNFKPPVQVTNLQGPQVLAVVVSRMRISG